MIKTDEKISQNSIWNVSTPSLVAQSLPFYGLEAGHFYAEKDYRVDRDFHDSFLLLYCINGCGHVSYNGAEYDIKPGQSFLLDCHFPHAYFSLDNNWDFLWLHFNGSMCKVYFDLVNPEGFSPIDFAKNNEFCRLFSNITKNLSDKDLTGSLYHSSSIEGLLINCIEKRSSKALRNQSSNLDEIIKKAVEYLKENYKNSISLDDLCKDLHISKYHFVRCFKRITGIPPYSYLINLRITAAKRLLVTSSLTIEKIGEETGFKDTAGFIFCFKSHVGQTPLHYRKAHC